MATGLLLAFAGQARAAFDPVYEAKNFLKTTERNRITLTPAYRVLLIEKTAVREAQLLQILAGDPERTPLVQLCAHKGDGCAGDVRLYDWVTRGAGIALPIAFTARNGSTLSGHMWATAQGAAKRPAVVLTNGSVQAPEELYWAYAQALAKAGYVVLTFDPQGQGYSDTFGEGADALDGVPSQEGRPFFDNTEDALDFLLSTPQALYSPRKSCTTGTDHGAKQRRRVQARKASAYDPLHDLIDPEHVGLVGHSLGAAAVSYVGQIDPRVDAIVAFDNLSAPHAGFMTGQYTCKSSPRPADPPARTPGLGISNDYGLLPQPNLAEPDINAKVAGSMALSAAHIDTMEVVIRGGTHFETSFIPNPAFGGSLRGYDLAAFYTVAWMDRYLKADPTAAARLRSDRWRNDARGAAVDADKDGNLFSRYHRSRIDATGLRCEALRAACALKPDGGPADYDVVAIDQAKESSPDGPGRDAAKPWTITTDPAGATGAPPAANKLPDPQPPKACADTVRPTSTIRKGSLRIRRSGVRLSGTARDRGCKGARGRVARVLVAVAKVEAGRCRWLGRGAKLPLKPTSCRLARYNAAHGGARWSFSRKAALPAGNYRVLVRAVDRVANVEKKRTSAAYLRGRVR